MTINVKCTYLGKSDNSFSGQDGKVTSYSTLNFYDFGVNEAFSLNVVHGATTAELMAAVNGISSSKPVNLKIRLVPKDKLYRMQLLEISA